MHTFEIRFARTAGLAALFEAPANHFRWKGAGLLSIDAGGISIAVKRGLMNLFSRRHSHRVAAAEITQVYREGDALRLEFGAEADRQILPIWTEGHAEAAQIVKLLPTRNTVEIEHSTRGREGFRIDRRLLFWLLSGATLLLAGLLLLLRIVANFADVYGGAGPPVASTREAAAPAINLPATGAPRLAIEDILASERLKQIQSGTPEHDVAREQQKIFESELMTLKNQYRYLQQAASAEALESLNQSWWSTAIRIETSEPMSGPAFTGFREAQLAVISSWRSAVALQAAGIRLRDERFAELAVRQRELAETYEQLVRAYVP
jgi:hypothetical protein